MSRGSNACTGAHALNQATPPASGTRRTVAHGRSCSVSIGRAGSTCSRIQRSAAERSRLPLADALSGGAPAHADASTGPAGEQRLDVQVRKPDPGQIRKPFDAEVPRPPLGEELSVERVEALELEEPVESEEDRPRDAAPAAPSRMEQVGEDAEVERQLGHFALAGPFEGAHDEELHQAVRRARAPAHHRERVAAGGRRGDEVEEAADPAVGVLGERDERVGCVDVVVRHREAALRLRSPPQSRDLGELRAQARIALERSDDPEAVAGAVEARDGLPDLADLPAFERESIGAKDGLVAELDRAQSEPAIARELLAARPEDRDPPAVRAREPAELGQQLVELVLVPDGIAADERGACDDPVRQEGAPVRREQVALVAAQGEEGQAVAAVGLDEPPRGAPLFDGLADAGRERPEPEIERADGHHGGRRGEHVLQPVRPRVELEPGGHPAERRERARGSEQRT